MKTFISLIFIYCIGVASGLHEEAQRKYREQLAATVANPTDASVFELATVLSGVARNMDPQEPADVILYEDIQNGMVSIPGYITYFTDELARLKESVKDRPPGSGRRHDYDRPRGWYIRGTFPHLPAPETIRAIGGYLNDDYDILPKGEESSGATPPNSDLASFALAKIGLVDPPAEDLAAQRKWWEEVKSGKRTFAFLGKSVSYRFLPDGTTETTPRDAARDPRRFPPPLDPGKSSQPPAAVVGTPWIIGGVSLLVLGILGYLLKRKARA